jgi:protein-tyrosine-phosphatase
MAAAIGKAEIATRLGIPFENIDSVQVRAISAGVSAKVGEAMTVEAKQALRELGFHPNGHRARSVTVELADQAEKIFCMTEAHRNAVVALVPAVTGKTHCLDPDGDIDDPIGRELPAYIDCARRIHELVQVRFDEISLAS